MSGRKGSKKVRSGCITCKIRKVKCDEARPACNRCTRAGRTCDGYRDLTPPTSRGKALAIRPTGNSSTSTTPKSVQVSLPSWMAGADPRETLAFDFYVRRVAPILAGEFDSQFWAVLVPRLCQAEPAIRYAVFSLGAVYRAVDESGTGMPPPPEDPATTFPITTYNRAISALLDLDAGTTSGQDPTAIYLLACVLFVCIEFLLGNDASSQAHIDQGRKLIARLYETEARQSSPQMEIIRRSFVPIYSRFAVTSFTKGHEPEPIPPQMNLYREVPAEFSSTDHARACLYSVLDDSLRASKQVLLLKYEGMLGGEVTRDMPAVEKEHQKVLSHLKAWNIAFTLYLANRSAMGGQQEMSPGEKTMTMYYHVAYIWVSNSYSRLETSYDDYMEHFTSIVSLASSMQGTRSGSASDEVDTNRSQKASSPKGLQSYNPLQTDETDDPQRRPSASGSRTSAAFIFHDGVIPPLYYTTLRCRHPQLRRKALSLLEDLSRVSPREALWDARYLVPIARRVIEIEGREYAESGSGSGFGTSAGAVSAEAGFVASHGHRHPDAATGKQNDYLGREGSAATGGHEPPFGVPDEMRVRELLIGGKVDQRKDPTGTWITILQKPYGIERGWEVWKEWIPVTT